MTSAKISAKFGTMMASRMTKTLERDLPLGKHDASELPEPEAEMIHGASNAVWAAVFTLRRCAALYHRVEEIDLARE